MFLLLDLWELSVSFFQSVLRANVSAFEVQRGPYLITEKKGRTCALGAESRQCSERVAVQGCPRATRLAPAPAGPGLITCEVLLALFLVYQHNRNFRER